MLEKGVRIKTTDEYVIQNGRCVYGTVLQNNADMVAVHVDRQTGDNIILRSTHNVAFLPAKFVTETKPH